MRYFFMTSMLLTIYLLADHAYAAGYAAQAESPGQIGTLYGGATAATGDTSSQFFNPATMATQRGNTVILGTTIASPDTTPGTFTGTTGANTPITGSQEDDSVAAGKAVPVFYGAMDINPRFRAGIAVTSPWGLSTKYKSDWEGRYHGVTSDVKSLNINPSVSYKINDKIAIGAGVQAQYIKGRLTNAVDCGLIGALNSLGTTPGTIDCYSDMTGDDWGYGYNAGILLTPTDRLSIGAGYRSAIKHRLRGDVDFSVPAPLAGLLNDTQTRTAFNTPAMTTAGIQYKVSDMLTLGADIHFTEWSKIQEGRVTFANGTPDVVTATNYQDTFLYSMGVTYAPSSTWKFMTGVALDESPVRAAYRNVRIPDADRRWISVGTEYAFNDMVAFSIAYAHAFVDDATINQTLADPNNSLRGNLTGDYETSIDLLAMSLRYNF